MIAADSSSLIAYFQGDRTPQTQRIDEAFSADELRVPPVVITELLSDPSPVPRKDVEEVLLEIQLLEVLDGYWHRAGALRKTILSHRLKCKTADALVAQSCIDHDIALITHDADFRRFAKYCGLKLA